MLLLSMFVLPTLLATVTHLYLEHKDVCEKKIIVLLIGYFFVINTISISVSYLRGVKGFNIFNMTTSYKIKYLLTGIAFAIVAPVLLCLILDNHITLLNLKRFLFRMFMDIRHYGGYAIRSANAELHVEVANSFLNWMWWLIEPLCMMLIYTVIFGVVFNASEEYFPIFIFIGLAMWSFFRRGIDCSVNTIRSNRAIITKVYIPKYILYLSRLLVYGFKMLVSFGVVIVMMAIYRVKITMHIFEAIPIIMIFFLLTFGIGTILMHYGVYVNDLAYITGILLTMLMYMTGVFYNIAKRIPEPYGELLERFNPIAFLISAMRGSLLYGQSPDWRILALWTLISVIISVLGVYTIYQNENAYVKVI